MARVALLESFAPAMQDRIRGIAGPGLDLVFAASDAEQDRAAALAEADYAVVRAVRMPASLLDHAPKLRLIHQWGTGTDGLPVAEALARGIAIARSPGLNAASVADLTLGLMLACLRRIPAGDARIRRGDWAEPDLYETGRDLTGARVGLFGYGAIAAEVAKRLRGFDCEVVYHRRSGPMDGVAGHVSFDALISGVDILSLHAPATPETRDIVNADTLARMRPGTLLINTSRGELVDEAALAAALTSGQVGAAGIDAYRTEPLPSDAALRHAPNTVFSAHSGGRTRQNFERMVRHWSGNIRTHAGGAAIDPKNLVT